MDPQSVFCPNLDCAARGRVGAGNIRVHSHKERRYRCTVCRKTFVETTGTVFYRRQKLEDEVTRVTTLLAWGCPPQAIVAAFGWDERTVYALLHAAGQHCQQVHEHLVQQPRDLGQVQADEIRAKLQGVIMWAAMALQVHTRLWLGGVVSPQRDVSLLVALTQLIRACALCRPLLLCVDGFKGYVHAFRLVLREPIPTGGKGRPRLRAWDNVCIVQIVKHAAPTSGMGLFCRLVQGAGEQVKALLQQTQGEGVVNTAYIERLNATFRARLSGLVRRGRALLRETCTLQRGLYLIGTVYNFCTEHQSLRVRGVVGGHKWLGRTPAMAAGITDHCWTVQELLLYRVPPPRWTPPKRRGRPSNEIKRLIQQWG